MCGRGLIARTDVDKQKAPIPELLLVGCGRMGSALLDGWIREGLTGSWIVDPAARSVPAPHRLASDLAGVAQDAAPSVVILAIKPQLADAVLPALGARFPDALYLSIMAGRSLAAIAAALGQATGGARAVMRAMPNLPASIGHGITGVLAAPQAARSATALVERLLGAVGEVAWVETEAALDAVTAVSGSGPAYVFLLAELLERAGIAQGLPPSTARSLARATIVGAGALLAHDPTDARAMREAVTSKAGTTEAALAVLMADEAWPRAVDAAVAAAAARARALAA